MKKRVSILLAGTLLTAALTGCGNGTTPGTDAQPGGSATDKQTGGAAITMRIAHSSSEDSAYHKLATAFGEELEALAPGAVNVQIFPNGQLGKESEYLDGMDMGTLEAAFGGRGSQIDPRLDVYNLPFIFEDEAHMDKVLGYGTACRQVLDDIFYENGYKCLMNYDPGFRGITANKPIYSVDDVKGLDIRTPNTAVLVDLFSAWGANPTPLDFGEVYTALQQGVIGAQENPPELIYTSQFYEVQDYFSQTNHGVTPGQMMVGRTFWESLAPDLQQAMQQAANKAVDKVQPEIRSLNQTLLDEFEQLGMKVIREEEIDRESFRTIALEAYGKYYDTIGRDLIEQVLDAAK